jgi:hypothetical protein
LFQRVADVTGNAGGDSLAVFSNGLVHKFMVPFWHRAVNVPFLFQLPNLRLGVAAKLFSGAELTYVTLYFTYST